MRNLYRNKKGLSTVISTILMIMVVMVGMSVAFSYVVFYSNTYQTGIGSSVLESLTIEDIWLHGTTDTGYSNQVTFWVYNSGQIGATINAIYINGVAATNGSSTYNYKIAVPIGQHIPITVQGQSNWQTNTNYIFKVTTLRGSNFDESITTSAS